METQIAEWRGPRMDVRRQECLLSHPGFPPCPLYVERTETPRYVARHPELPNLSCYGDNPSLLEAFVESELAAARDVRMLAWGWDGHRPQPTGVFYVEEGAHGDYVDHTVVGFLYEEVN